MIISVIIPVLNEAESLKPLLAELREVAAAHGYDFDILLVDDGSTDASWAVIAGLAQEQQGVRGIRFRRNFGKAAALAAGVAEARAPLIITMDADLQDDPHEIPNFLAKLNEGFDLVSGWKQVRHDPWHKVLPSRLFNAAVSWLTGVRLHDHNCGMKCYRREVFDEVELYGDRHRFIPVLAAARGFRVGELVIHHRARQFGQSKYGWSRLPKGFFDLLTVKFLTTYAYRPQHLLGMIGLLMGLVMGITGLAMFFLAQMGFNGLTGFRHDPLFWNVIRFISLISQGLLVLAWGGLFLGLGLLAELIVATGPRKKPYSIVEKTP